MNHRSLGGLLAGALLASSLISTGPAGAEIGIPRTGFERSEGRRWTSHSQELRFLKKIDRQRRRMELEVVGRSLEGRPLHLVKLGAPAPHKPSEALRHPTVMFVCSQHGDEPAGREACLSLVRDLAYTYGVCTCVSCVR